MLNYQPKEERPPYARFTREAVKDKRATLEAGQVVYRDVDYIHLTPIGSKDTVIHEVVAWLQDKARMVENGRFSAKWLEDFRAAYAMWQQGEELPLNGTPVKNWGAATPAEVATLIELNLRTVEDLAQAPEEAIRRMGMGGRALQNRARAYLSQATDGRLVEENAELRRQLGTLKLRNESLEEQVKTLKAMLPSPAEVVVERVVDDDFA
jgi:hypothetical protein